MKIGILIGRIGGIDGVALETEKWITVLERLGHEICILTGAIEGPVNNATVMPELAFSHPFTVAAQEIAFFSADHNEGQEEESFLAQLEAESEQIRRGIRDWRVENEVECLLAENASALPCHLTMGMALRRVYEETGLPVVSHDHDFFWERGDRYETPFAGVRDIIAECFPVSRPNVKHAVINSAAKQTLADRFGITDAVVAPNVMDFDVPFGRADAYNADLRAALGVAADDLLLFQITRVVRRKGIEIAIDLVHRLCDPRVKLVITGTFVDEQQDDYADELHAQVAQQGLGDRVLFAGDLFANHRHTEAGRKIYNLSDAYAHATACTYFSRYEGFGNAFVEAVAARRPIFVNNYEPVYWPDIGALGFETVMIEKGHLTAEAVAQVASLIGDPARRAAMAKTNFDLGQRHFSYEALARILEPLFRRAG